MLNFQPASSSEIWKWVHSVYGDELGLTSEDDADYVRPNGTTLSSLNDIAAPLSTNSNSSGFFSTNLKDEVSSFVYGARSGPVF